MKNMKTENVLKLILKMGMPMVISMMVNSLYNIVDSLFVAKMSENAMTALSLVFPIQNLISSIMIGFGIGINAVVSFYLGVGKELIKQPVRDYFWVLSMALCLL